ncbi:MAG: stage III sporulation AC/AD family protein [Clostridia bacterium]|nr:stage III sporulation AC/AD family protein [Clostridia bacterium]
MNVLTLLGAGVLLAISFYLLNILGAKSAPLYLALGALFLLALSAEPYFRAVQLLVDIPTNENTRNVAETVCKALAIGYLVGVGADLCENLGAVALSKSLVFGGRVLIFSLGIPYLMGLISLAREWLSL